MTIKRITTLGAGACLAALLATTAQADCYGSGSIKNCYDAQSGNSYSVQQIGNQTYINGSNSRTGSRWNQTSQRIGNTTYHNGRSASGDTWRGTSTQIGGSTYHNGTDSSGNPYSGITNCGIAGCD
ncbi:hypothetical protein [Halomonas sp. IOP_31]|uniref:hypothetical protein n=1 Tax=Halomonas sp. IOP_31 TaxID=2876584 RepID=UPI001E301EE6|nr:hypothetical protein [Halomonas sp. IOP_31]MCD6006871.1 hypothetical protein [Halomonas sp. IOP_31]